LGTRGADRRRPSRCEGTSIAHQDPHARRPRRGWPWRMCMQTGLTFVQRLPIHVGCGRHPDDEDRPSCLAISSRWTRPGPTPRGALRPRRSRRSRPHCLDCPSSRRAGPHRGQQRRAGTDGQPRGLIRAATDVVSRGRRAPSCRRQGSHRPPPSRRAPRARRDRTGWRGTRCRRHRGRWRCARATRAARGP